MRIIYSYQGKEEVYNEGETDIIIGRVDERKGVSVDLDLHPDQSVSRKHARIWMEGGQYWIEDLGSRHGTLVDGVNIKGQGRMALTPRVQVKMGNTMLKLKAEAELRANIRVEVKCLPTFNYSLVHADIPFLSDITVFNDGDASLKDAELQAVLSGYAESETGKIPSIPPKSSHRVEALPRFQFHRNKFRDLPEPETVPLEVWVNKEPVALASLIAVKMLPPNAWYWPGHHRALAGFVMHNNEAVKQVIFDARHPLRRLMGTEAFADAIESEDPDRVEKVVKAIYFCLQEQYAINYEFEPRTYEPDWQMVRFHHEVINELKGTCIDLALLLAACLEHVYLDPMIIIVKTAPKIQHALIGCWRGESPLQDPIVRSGELVQGWVPDRILLLDSVGYARGKDADQSFPDCKRSAKNYLDKACAQQCHHRFEYGLDTIAARDRGLMPMPFGEGMQFERAAEIAIFRARREAEAGQSLNLSARHLLLGLLSLENGLMRQVLARFGEEKVNNFDKIVRKSIPRNGGTRRILPETEGWQTVMKRAEEIATLNGTLLVTEADLATALLETASRVDDALKYFGITRQKCLDVLKELTKSGPIKSEWCSSAFID